MTVSSSSPAITARGVCKSFGEHAVLDQVDLEVAEGTVHNDRTSADDPEPSAETAQVRARAQFGDVLIARSSVPNRQGDT